MATPRNRYTTVSRWGLGGSLTAVLLVGMAAGCGGGGTREAGSQSVGAAETTASDSSTETTSESEAAANGRLNPIINLCGVSELDDKASALYPGRHIKCIPGHGTPTSVKQVSSAAWTAGEVDPATSGIADEHTIQARVEGNRPDRDTTAPHITYETECPPPSAGMQCEDKELELDGAPCSLRKQVYEVGGPTITGWQAGCYIGRDSKTGLDVSVQVAATKLSRAEQIEDFTAAVIGTIRDE